MEVYIYLIPLTLLLAVLALVVFFWAMRNGQYEDLDSPAARILHQEERNEHSAEDSK